MSATSFKMPENCALLIIDMQNGFCEGGGLAVSGGHDIVPIINKLQSYFDGTRIFASQDWHPDDHKSFAVNHPGKAPYDEVLMPYGLQRLWPTHCVQNTHDAAFHPHLKLKDDARVMRKGTHADIDSYSAFLEVDKKSKPLFDDGRALADTMKAEGITRVVVCGLAYDFCVGFSALDARAAGFEVFVVKDATRGVNIPLPDGRTTVDDMDAQLKAAGVVVVQDDAALKNALAAKVAPTPASKPSYK